jgi:hypothetical protein
MRVDDELYISELRAALIVLERNAQAEIDSLVETGQPGDHYGACIKRDEARQELADAMRDQRAA